MAYKNYTILCESTYDELAAKVNEYLKKGYEPLGGFAVKPGTYYDGSECNWYYQAIVEPVSMGVRITNFENKG
jgi:hypothetical protein